MAAWLQIINSVMVREEVLVNFLKNVLRNRKLLISLINSDFKSRYLGNHFGIIWAFIQPLVMVAVYWFVFTRGLKVGKIDNKIPFLIWMLSGLVPWFIINDTIMSGSGSIVQQAFLVKKIVFEVKLLPLVKIGSAWMANSGFWLFLFVCLVLYKYYPTLMWLQVLYYILCTLCFTTALVLLLSSLTVFMLDVSQFVSIFMQIMFWVTPTMWNQNILPASLAWMIKLNPFAYIVCGVRDALIYNIPFWVHYKVTAYFWVLTFVLFVVGNTVFNRLRPHFADVL